MGNTYLQFIYLCILSNNQGQQLNIAIAWGMNLQEADKSLTKNQKEDPENEFPLGQFQKIWHITEKIEELCTCQGKMGGSASISVLSELETLCKQEGKAK